MSFSPPWRSLWLFRLEDQLTHVSAVRWKRDLEKGRGCVRASPSHVVLPLEQSGALDHWNMPILGQLLQLPVPPPWLRALGLCDFFTALNYWNVQGRAEGSLLVVWREIPALSSALLDFCCHHKLLVWIEVGSVTFWFKVVQICWIAFWGAEVCGCKRTRGAPGCLGTWCQCFTWRFS